MPRSVNIKGKKNLLHFAWKWLSSESTNLASKNVFDQKRVLTDKGCIKVYLPFPALWGKKAVIKVFFSSWSKAVI